MAGEEFRNPADDTRCVDSAWVSRPLQCGPNGQYPRLALEVLHNVKEPIVDVWLLMKLNLDLVEIAQRILQSERRSALTNQQTRVVVATEILTLSIGCWP